MKICAAQTRSIKGDIQNNIAIHKKLIDLAIANGADLIIFPELSLTGYEPTLAKELATNQDDGRFDDFQEISDANQMTIGVGVPTKSPAGICISMGQKSILQVWQNLRMGLTKPRTGCLRLPRNIRWR
jgi:predicted amidohydrolase